MCFSSTASFTAAALLLPVGVTCGRLSCSRPETLPLAMTPLFFGLQQALEGLVWVGIDTGGMEPLTHRAAVAYLFFAYAFWLAWIPWSALRYAGASAPAPQRRLIGALLLLGVAVGLALWLPLALAPGRIAPAVVHGSLEYNSVLLAHGVISHGLGSGLYALIITVPLLLTGSARLRWFALALLAAFAAAQIGFVQAFTSVWCYFSALISLLILWIVHDQEREPALAQVL